MPTKTTFGVFIFAAMAIVLFNAGCTEKKSNAFGEFEMPSQKPPAQPQTPVDPDPGGDPDYNNKNFYVGLSPSDTMIAYAHKSTGFADTCAIPADTNSSQDITCLVEVPEGELYNLGLSLLFNVPKNFCAYLKRDTYWYYNRSVGYGPSQIVFTSTISGGNTTTACTADGVSCDNNPVMTYTYNNNSLSPSCTYSCCLGGYRIRYVVDDQDAGTNTQTNTEFTSWGNNVSNCIGGAGRTSWSIGSDSQGFPLAAVTPAFGGVNEIYSMRPPVEMLAPLNRASNRSLANYYTPALHTHTGFYTPRVSNKPFYLDPVDDLSGNAIPIPTDAYTFSCYDIGYELLHRIRVYVREWDTRSNFIQYIASEGTAGNPNSINDCSNLGPGEPDSCNDFTDADNFLDTVGGSYDTNPATGNRSNYFPNDIYL